MTADPDDHVRREIEALSRMDRPALLAQWHSSFGCKAPSHLSKSLMTKAIAYELQVKAFGALSTRTVRALKSAARAKDHRPGLTAGTRLAREWNGELHEVDITDDGYLWRDRRYPSLSAVARAITGTRWSGPRFFGVGGN